VLRVGAASGVQDSSAAQPQPWGAFTSLAEVDALLSWLNPQGLREGPLKTALQRVRDNMVLFAPPPGQDTAAAGAGGAEEGQAAQEQQAHSSRAGTPAVTAAPPPPVLHPRLLYKQQLKQASMDLDAAPNVAAGPHSSSSPQKQQQQLQELDAAAVAALQQQLVAAAAADDDAAAADALREGLGGFNPRSAC